MKLTELQLKVIQARAHQGESYPKQTLKLVDEVMDLRKELESLAYDYARLLQTMKTMQGGTLSK